MAEGRGLAITALGLGIFGLFTAGGFGLGSLVGLSLAGVALLSPSSRAGRDVAWSALAANLMALTTILPLAAGLLAYRASPAFESGDALPVPATPSSIEDALPPAAPPPPPPPPPQPRETASRSQPGSARSTRSIRRKRSQRGFRGS